MRRPSEMEGAARDILMKDLPRLPSEQREIFKRYYLPAKYEEFLRDQMQHQPVIEAFRAAGVDNATLEQLAWRAAFWECAHRYGREVARGCFNSRLEFDSSQATAHANATVSDLKKNGVL